MGKWLVLKDESRVKEYTEKKEEVAKQKKQIKTRIDGKPDGRSNKPPEKVTSTAVTTKRNAIWEANLRKYVCLRFQCEFDSRK